MIALPQVLWLVRELFERQIDRKSNKLRERLIVELCGVLGVPNHDRTDLVRYVLGEAARCGDPEIEARASRALKILDVIDAIDALEDHKREAREAQMFGKGGAR